MPENSNRARDHLANERTFLAWLRTGFAVIVFGFAIGRFAIAIRQFGTLQGKPLATTGHSVWFAMIAILAGVVMTVGGWLRHRRVREQLEQGEFEPAGSMVDVVALVAVIFGLALGGYLLYIEKAM